MIRHLRAVASTSAQKVFSRSYVREVVVRFCSRGAPPRGWRSYGIDGEAQAVVPLEVGCVRLRKDPDCTQRMRSLGWLLHQLVTKHFLRAELAERFHRQTLWVVATVGAAFAASTAILGTLISVQ